MFPFKSQYSRIISISSRLFPTIRIYRRWIPADVSTPNVSKTLLSKRERLTHPCTTTLMSCGLQSPLTPLRLFDFSAAIRTILCVCVMLGLSAGALTAYHAEQTAKRIKLGTLWENNDFVFTQWNGKVMNSDTVSQWFSALLRRHKLPYVNFHALRHSSATLALQSGANIKSVAAHLSHSQLNTTNRYLHALESADKAMADKFNTMFEQTTGPQKSGEG